MKIRSSVVFPIVLIVLFIGAASFVSIYKEPTQQVKGTDVEFQRVVTDEPHMVLTLTNNSRDKAGEKPVMWSATLAISAQKKLSEMARLGVFSHSINGEPFTSAILESGYPTIKRDGSSVLVGENLSCGYDTPEKMQIAWMDSEYHRENVLNPKYREMGVAIGTIYLEVDKSFCKAAVVHFGTGVQ